MLHKNGVIVDLGVWTIVNRNTDIREDTPIVCVVNHVIANCAAAVATRVQTKANTTVAIDNEIFFD